MTAQNNSDKQPVRTRPLKYPYEQLTDREFEELLYSIFKKEIEAGDHLGYFDDVFLMPGVGEQGRDCILLYQGANVGLVQCKHSGNPTDKTDKPTIAREIIKFVLYYLHDKSLITDPYNFTYFFAISGDFTGPAITLLSDFNHKITQEKDFETWVIKVLEKHETLPFSLDAIKDELSTVLRAIKVKRLVRVDLDSKLAKSTELVLRFFPIQTVISIVDSEEIVRQSIQAIEERYSKIPTLIEAEKALASEYQEQLDYAQRLLDNFMPKQAGYYLQSLRERIWDKASSDDRYRILVYIGFAYLQQNQEPQAAQMLIDALKFNPNSPKAIANAALGFLLQGNNERCRDLAKQALIQDPTLERAYSMLVWSANPDEPFNSILANIPETYQRMAEVSIALGNLAQRRNLLPEAEQWFRVAIQVDSRNHPEPRGKLATVLFAQLQNDYISPMPGFVNPHIATLREIVKLCDEAWEHISQTEMRPYRIEWLVNRAAARALLGDKEGAEQDLDDALKEEPDSSDIIRNRAILAYQKGKLSQAATLFRRILDFDPKADARFWLAVVLFEDGRLNDADALAKETALSSQTPSLIWEAKSLMVFIRLRQEDLPGARTLANTLRQDYPDHVATLVLDAMILRHENKRPEAKSLLTKAQSMLTQETSLATQYRLVQELCENEMFQVAATLLEKIVDKQVDSNPVRQLLLCYYHSGHLEPALNICRTLREKYGPLQFVTVLETAIYEEIDDLLSARHVCQEYLTLYPDDFQVLLRLAVVNYRLKGFDALDDFLKKDVDFQQLSLTDYAQIASLLLARGYTWKGLNVMYEARRRFFNDPLAHQSYASTVLFRISRDEEHNEWFNINDVRAGVAVYLTDQLGHHPRWIIIDERDDVDVRRNELPPNHSIISKLLGKQVGDCAEILHGGFSERICIQEIKSKFIHALHETMEMYPTYFIDAPWMWQFPVQYSDEGEVTAETFQPLFAAIDERQTYIESAKQAYREGKFTIGTLADVLGMNPIEILGTLTQEPATGIRCCSGHPLERQTAVSIANPSSRFIVDITSLITMHELDVGDQITSAYGKFGVVRKTLELIEHLLEDKLSSTKAYMVLGKEGNQYTRGFVTEEIIENNRRFLERILTWAETNCQILPCRAALSVKREARQMLGELIGPAFVETVLVANDKQMVLYSDDILLRNLAKKEYGVPGIWTQIALLRLHSEKLVSDALYAQATIKLACLHYHHTTVNAYVLIEAAKEAKWQPTYPFTKVVEILDGKHSDAKSSVRVATEWVHQLWRQKLPDEQYEGLVTSMISVITQHRNRGERILVLNTFEDEMGVRLYLAPLAVRQIQELVRLWKRTHIL